MIDERRRELESEDYTAPPADWPKRAKLVPASDKRRKSQGCMKRACCMHDRLQVCVCFSESERASAYRAKKNNVEIFLWLPVAIY